MFHLDNNSGISSMPKPAAQQSSSTRWFTEGSGNNSPSWPGQDWFNIVQAELLNTLAAAGINPDKSKFNQLSLSIKAIVNNDAFLKANLLSEIKDAGASAQKSAREALDVVDASIQRKGLVQLSSATDIASESVAATPKAVKAVNDELNAVKKTLGTAASKDVQTSKDDITAGRLLVNGGALALRTTLAGAGRPLTDFNDLPANSVSFGYDNATNTPGFTGSVLDYAGSSGNYRVQLAAQYNGNGNRIAFRTRNGDSTGVWNAWGEFYHTRNKPSAGDVGALPITGGTLKGALAVVQNGPGVTLQSSASGQGVYLIGKDYNGTNTWYIGRGGSSFNVSLYNYKGANGINLNEDGSIAFNLANGKTFTVNGQIVPSTYANFDVRYYTKAQSDARYVQNVRVGAVGTFKINKDVWSEAPVGAFMTGWYYEGDNPGGDSVHYRPIQININGAWRTITA